VIFKYEPEAFRRGLAVSLTGIVIFLVSLGLCIRKDKQKK
jgi:hypothetical protein